MGKALPYTDPTYWAPGPQSQLLGLRSDPRNRCVSEDFGEALGDVTNTFHLLEAKKTDWTQHVLPPKRVKSTATHWVFVRKKH